MYCTLDQDGNVLETRLGRPSTPVTAGTQQEVLYSWPKAGIAGVRWKLDLRTRQVCQDVAELQAFTRLREQQQVAQEQLRAALRTASDVLVRLQEVQMESVEDLQKVMVNFLVAMQGVVCHQDQVESLNTPHEESASPHPAHPDFSKGR